MSQTETSSTLAEAGSDLAAVHSLAQSIVAAWATSDADAFAAVFTEDGSVILPGGVYLKSRVEIRDFMAAAYAGPFKGTAVAANPIDVRFISPDTSLMITEGGVLLPGETQVAEERAIQAMWVSVKRDGEWKVAAYQNTRVAQPAG
jgi:uncharacterized protein (TIGR02246 family)